MKNKFRHFAVLALITLGLATLWSCSDGDANESTVTDGKVTGYVIKIDGKEIGHLTETDGVDKLSAIFAEMKMRELESLSAEVVKVTLSSRLEAVEIPVYADKALSAEELASKYYESGGKLSFEITISERERAYISFETVYVNSSAYYEGERVVKTKGQRGERELLYEVTYVDGSEKSRSLVSDTVLTEAVNETVLVGTKKSTASTGKYAWPLKNVYITSSYGGRYLGGKYDFHLGVDLRAASGTNVYAADGGKVVYAGWLGTYGYLVRIQHDNGDMTYYAHLSRISVSSGSRVYKGQIIAKSGATGNVTGAHLHFEIRKNGSTVNPVSYLPSTKGIAVAQSAYPESCSVYREACLSHSAPQAFLSSIREREERLLLRRPSHAR